MKIIASPVDFVGRREIPFAMAHPKMFNSWLTLGARDDILGTITSAVSAPTLFSSKSNGPNVDIQLGAEAVGRVICRSTGYPWPDSTAAPVRCPSCSLLARSTCHRCIPNLLSLDIKNEGRVRRRGVPVIACELTFELARRPTCVAESDQCFFRADLMTDVAKHLLAWGHGGQLFHSDGVGAIVVSAVYDKADPRLHGAAREDPHITFDSAVALTKKPKELRQGTFPERAIYCDAEGAVLAVLHHKDDRAAKARIANRRGGDQNLTHQRRILRLELKSWRYGSEEWGCYKQSS